MNNATSHPELYEGLDFVRVWKHIARLLGAKAPEMFMKSRVANQGEIQKGVQQGNMVPLNEAEAAV